MFTTEGHGRMTAEQAAAKCDRGSERGTERPRSCELVRGLAPSTQAIPGGQTVPKKKQQSHTLTASSPIGMRPTSWKQSAL